MDRRASHRSASVHWHGYSCIPGIVDDSGGCLSSRYHLETIAVKNRDKRRIEMANAKEELVEKIERVRKKMDLCIERREEYRKIYEYSVELDELLNQYIVAGY